MCKCMGCGTRQWPTRWDLARKRVMLVWIVSIQTNAQHAECERSELAPISRIVREVEPAGVPSPQARPALSPWVSPVHRVGGRDRKWVGQSLVLLDTF